MCLILISKNSHPNFKLVVATNRDEYYSRPTKKASWWNNNEILSGIDIKENGTWLGINKQGNFVAITNYRNPSLIDPNKKSRGHLSSDFLKNKTSNDQFLKYLQSTNINYNPYNILYGDINNIYHYSNISNKNTALSDKTHTLSNHLLNTSWFKTDKSKKHFQSILKNNHLKTDHIFELLFDQETAKDSNLPNTGINIETERLLSSIFIKTDEYGTRCSTIILVDNENKVQFIERTYNKKNNLYDEVSYDFKVEN